jgi:ATP-dependent DNA helicase PIF1
MDPNKAAHRLESADSAPDDDEGNFPIEYLNSITASALPPHGLIFKQSCPLILLRTLDAERGLCNGTRLILLGVYNRLLKVRIMNGSHKNQEAWIPRIDLHTQDGFLPFTLKRRQFPVKVAFAMTINKSQGQSLDTTYIYLPEPIFAHGQLYVALSRSALPDKLRIFIRDIPGKQGKMTVNGVVGYYTRNIVYHEVLIR